MGSLHPQEISNPRVRNTRIPLRIFQCLQSSGICGSRRGTHFADVWADHRSSRESASHPVWVEILFLTVRFAFSIILLARRLGMNRTERASSFTAPFMVRCAMTCVSFALALGFVVGSTAQA